MLSHAKPCKAEHICFAGLFVLKGAFALVALENFMVKGKILL
jgi:hypothetical protein